eukprot:4054800-Amphidinium_carterae.1
MLGLYVRPVASKHRLINVHASRNLLRALGTAVSLLVRLVHVRWVDIAMAELLPEHCEGAVVQTGTRFIGPNSCLVLPWQCH